MSNWISSLNPAMRKKTLFIVGIHLVFVLILVLQPSFAKRSLEKKPLVIKTVMSPPVKSVAAKPVAKAAAPSPVKKTAPPVKTSTESKESKPVKKETSLPKKEPAIADKVVSQKKATAPPIPRAQISDALFKELEESIAKIEEKGLKSVKTAPLVLQVDGEASSFTEQLVFCLQEHLILPDYGEVKIQLDLREDGSVDRIVVLSAESKANKRYLEQHLPQLRFPKGGGHFVLTFANKE